VSDSVYVFIVLNDTLLDCIFCVPIFSFMFTSERGIFPNTEFIFDLELPHTFTPTNRDGEVDSFHLLNVDECIEKVMSSEFKTTSCPAVLDFLIRHGIITAESGTNLNP